MATGLEYATGGIGNNQYLANIKNWLQANPNATDAEVRIQMDKYGISPQDVATAIGQDPATIQAKYDALQTAPQSFLNSIHTPGASLYTPEQESYRNTLSAQMRSDPAYMQAEAQRRADAARASVMATPGADAAYAESRARDAYNASPWGQQQKADRLAASQQRIAGLQANHATNSAKMMQEPIFAAQQQRLAARQANPATLLAQRQAANPGKFLGNNGNAGPVPVQRQGTGHFQQMQQQRPTIGTGQPIPPTVAPQQKRWIGNPTNNVQQNTGPFNTSGPVGTAVQRPGMLRRY